MSISSNGCATSNLTLSVEAFSHKMADNKDNMGAVTHQLSAADDDMRKGGDVQEKIVASVALGTHRPCTFHSNTTDILQLLLLRPRSPSCGPRT